MPWYLTEEYGIPTGQAANAAGNAKLLDPVIATLEANLRNDLPTLTVEELKYPPIQMSLYRSFLAFSLLLALRHLPPIPQNPGSLPES